MHSLQEIPDIKDIYPGYTRLCFVVTQVRKLSNTLCKNISLTKNKYLVYLVRKPGMENE